MKSIRTEPHNHAERGDERIRTAVPVAANDPAYEAGKLDLTGIDLGRLIGQASVQADLAHWTHRMLQALDGYWLHCEGLPPRKWDTVRSESTGEDWWIRFEKYRARVESMIRAGGAA